MGGLALFLLSYSFFLALASPTLDSGGNAEAEQDPSGNPSVDPSGDPSGDPCSLASSPCGLNTECLVDNGEATAFFWICFSIGPESNHWLPLSLTN